MIRYDKIWQNMTTYEWLHLIQYHVINHAMFPRHQAYWPGSQRPGRTPQQRSPKCGINNEVWMESNHMKTHERSHLAKCISRMTGYHCLYLSEICEIIETYVKIMHVGVPIMVRCILCFWRILRISHQSPALGTCHMRRCAAKRPEPGAERDALRYGAEPSTATGTAGWAEWTPSLVRF